MSSTSGKPQRRVPQCARCRSHNIFSNVRGHKKVCQWRNCTCAKCQMVTEKRRITAVRVAVLRQERKRRLTSHRFNYNSSYQMGACSMMGRNMAEGYAAEHFIDNRQILLKGVPGFRPDIFHHMPTTFPTLRCSSLYPGLHREGEESLHGASPKSNSPPPSAAISDSVKNFEQEYVSLMTTKLNHDDDLSAGEANTSRDQSSRHLATHSQYPRGMFGREIPPPLYINSRISHEHPAYRSPAFPTESPRVHSMMLDVPPTLLCSHSMSRPSHRMTFPVGF